MIKDLFMAAAGFALACAFIYAPTAHADTVMHVMVYNVEQPTPTEHTVFRMPSRAVCEASLGDWDGLSNDAGDRSEARCLDDDPLGGTQTFQYQLKVYRDPEYGSTEYVYELPD